MGSLAEVGYYINLSFELEYLSKEEFEVLDPLRNKTSAKLYRLIEAVAAEV